MADDSVKYSDLLVDDGAIERAIAKFTEFIETYKKGIDDINAKLKGLEGSIKTASSTSSEGQAKIAKEAAEVDRLAKAQQAYENSLTDTAQEIARLNSLKNEQNRINKLTAQYLSSEEGSYNKLSAAYSLGKIELNKYSDAEIRSNKALREKQTELKKTYLAMSKYQETTGKHTLSVGNYEKANIRLSTSVNQLSRELPALGVNMNTFFLAISNNIPMLVDEINNVRTANAQLMKEGKQLRPLGKMITGAIFSWQTAMSVGIALLTIYGADLIKWIGSMIDGTNALSDQARAQKALNEARRNGLTSNNQGIIQTKILTDIIYDNKRSLDEQIDAFHKLQKLYPERLKNLKDDALFSRETANAIYELEQSLIAQAKAQGIVNAITNNYAEIAKKEFELTELNTKALIHKKKWGYFNEDDIAAYREINGEIQRLNRENAYLIENTDFSGLFKGGENGKAEIDNTLKYQREYTDSVIALMEEGKLKEFQILTETSKREIEDLKLKWENEKIKTKEGKVAVDEIIKNKEDKLQQDLIALDQKYENMRIKAEADRLKAVEERSKKLYDIAMNDFDQEYDLEMAKIDAMKATEAEKTRLRLEAEKDRLIKILKFNRDAISQLTQTEIDGIRYTIAAIDREIANINSGRETKDIYELIGIDWSEEKKDSFEFAMKSAMDSLGKYLSLKEQIADAAVKASEKEIDAARKALDYELQAKAEGYAYNVSQAKKELALAEANNKKALAQREKYQKAQLRLETISQASSLATASAKILQQFGWWGIPLIAVMLGAFAASKVEAAKLAQTETYGEGTVEMLEGGSHQSGNDIDLGRKKDGTRRRAEGGEFFAVINKRNSRKYRKHIPDIIKSLNSGIFENKYLGAFDQGGVSINMISNQQDLKRIEKDVLAIRKQGEKKYIPTQKGMMIRYKNLTTYVK